MIREMQLQDRDEFMAMCHEFYRSDACDHVIGDDCFAATFTEVMKKGPYARGYIFEKEGQIAGYALVSISFSPEVGGMSAFLEEAFIKKPFRSQGLGKEYFAFIEKEYGPTFKRFRLEATPSNTRAMKLYEKMGFSVLHYVQMVRDL